MPTCGCSKSCNCTVVSNGAPIIIQSGDPLDMVLVDVGKIGTADNIVSGSGRPTDPYSISWKDSVEFRPRAEEWRQLPYDDVWPTEPTLYSTPTPHSIFLWAPENDAGLTASNVILGAYADINTGGVTITTELSIIYGSFFADTGPARIAHYTSTNVNPQMACTGYLNPARTIVDLSSSGLRAEIAVVVRDPSNGIVAINEIRLWGIQV